MHWPVLYRSWTNRTTEIDVANSSSRQCLVAEVPEQKTNVYYHKQHSAIPHRNQNNAHKYTHTHKHKLNRDVNTESNYYYYDVQYFRQWTEELKYKKLHETSV